MSEENKINKLINEKTVFIAWLVSVVVSVLVPYFTLKQDIALESQRTTIVEQANAAKWDNHEKDFETFMAKLDKLNTNMIVVCTTVVGANCQK